jgi:hypothetical protein
VYGSFILSWVVRLGHHIFGNQKVYGYPEVGGLSCTCTVLLKCKSRKETNLLTLLHSHFMSPSLRNSRQSDRRPLLSCWKRKCTGLAGGVETKHQQAQGNTFTNILRASILGFGTLKR